MVSFSKLLDQGLRDAKCYEVYHPGKTCADFMFGSSGTLLIKCMKYFFPLVTVPLIVKGRNLRRKHVRDALNYYIELIVFGYLISQSVPIAQCGLRKLNGKFTKCNIIYIPMTFPTWAIWFISPRVARLFAAAVFQVTFEAAIRNSKNRICRTLCQSKAIQAFLFMTCSAYIMHTVQTYKVKTFWIIKSIPSPNRSHIDDKCSHDGQCSRFWLNDLVTNISIGLSIDLFKTFIGSITKNKSFVNDFGNKLLRLNFPTTFFLTSYSGIYKIMSCMLNRTRGNNAQAKHIIAAFLGGISFFFLPKLTILCYAISNCIEISWKLFEQKKFENSPKHIEIIKKIPFHRIYICLATGYMVHMYVFRSEVLSPMGFAIVSAFTGDQAPDMKADIYKYFKSIQ